MTDVTKTKRSRLAEPYLTKLFEELVRKGILLESIEQQVKIGTAESGSSNDKLTPAKRLIEQLYTFNAIIRTVHNAIPDKKDPLVNLLDLIYYFIEKQVIDIPLNDPRVVALFKSVNTIRAEDLSNDWLDTFEKSKIDLIKIGSVLLEYLSEIYIEVVGVKNNFITNPILREYPRNNFILSVKQDHSKVILFDIKFRTTISDIKSIILRSISRIKEYPFPFGESSKYLVIVIYTTEQDHTFDRVTSQFSRLLIDIDPSLIDNIFFIPVEINKAVGLLTKLEEFYKSISGLDLAFPYNDSPLSHQWTGPKSLSTLSSVFRYANDEIYGNILQLSLPTSNDYYIEYALISRKWKFKRVSFILGRETDNGIYVELAAQESNRRYWLQIRIGNNEPIINPSNRSFEYIVYVPSKEQGNWLVVNVDARVMFEKTFGKQGLTFQRIEGIRLRGEVKIAKISFE